MATLNSFRTARWVRTLNLLLQAVLFVTLFAGLNYLARNHPSRFDLTRHHQYSLSPETLSYLSEKNLQRPVRIVVTVPAESDNPDIAQARRDLGGLLNEYRYATEGNPVAKIKVEYLDVYQRRRDAEQLGIDQANSILVLSGDRRRLVSLGEIYRVEGGQKKDFRGEQAMTAAILDVCSPEKKKIYFLAGHGELQPTDVDPQRGLSSLSSELGLRNFSIDVLELPARKKIPEDAALLIAVAPQGPFSKLEQELLRQYLSASAGRLILLLPPGRAHGLEDLLLDWGVLVDDDLIVDVAPNAMTEQGELILGAFTKHPITQTLIDYNNLKLTIGPARSVRSDPGASPGNGLTITTLAATSVTAWGEVSYRLNRAPQFNPGIDIRALPGMEPKDRLGVAVASERVSVRDNLPFSVRGGRLVVFGTGDLIANNRIAEVAAQNIFHSAVNWLVDRDTQLRVPARPIERFQISLSASDATHLRYALWFALPGATLLLGLIVYWTRRT